MTRNKLENLMTEKSVFKHDQFLMFFQVFKLYSATIIFYIFDFV